MVKIQTAEYTLPTYWASYLVNGDASGLEDSEQAEIDRWLSDMEPGECVDMLDDSHFAHCNDASRMGGDVATYTFILR